MLEESQSNRFLSRNLAKVCRRLYRVAAGLVLTEDIISAVGNIQSVGVD